jgi:hypothetical protein
MGNQIEALVRKGISKVIAKLPPALLSRSEFFSRKYGEAEARYKIGEILIVSPKVMGKDKEWDKYLGYDRRPVFIVEKYEKNEQGSYEYEGTMHCDKKSEDLKPSNFSREKIVKETVSKMRLEKDWIKASKGISPEEALKSYK